MRIEILDGAAVINSIVASEEFAEANYPGAWRIAETQDTPPSPQPRQVTKLAFRNRFTLTEKATIEIAALDDPTAAMPQRQQAAVLRATVKDQEAATFVDLDRPDTRAGVEMLEAAGILAAGRAAIILDTEITPMERPL